MNIANLLFRAVQVMCNNAAVVISHGCKPMASIRTEIILQIKEIAREQNKHLAPLTDGLPLLESGLDSLAFAVLVARLEESLGYDPFTTSNEAYYPTTLGDFIGFYEKFEPATPAK
jgi:acyl carrier protein